MGRFGFVWLAGVRDLQWRRRRFVMAALATSLVFAITLVLAGIAESFTVEVRQVINALDADGFVVQDTQAGPFMSPSPFDATLAEQVASEPGVESALPLVAIVQPSMYLFGYRFRGANPKDGAAFVDQRLGVDQGASLRVGAAEFAVDKVTRGRTVLGGQPIVQLGVADAQRAVFGGADLVTAIAVRGTPRSLPAGYKFMDEHQAASDFLRPIGVVRTTIRIVSVMLWIVAAAIVGSVVYVSTLERARDISVFKATGADTRDILTALVLSQAAATIACIPSFARSTAQAVLMSLGASLVAIALAYAFAPVFPIGVTFAWRVTARIPAIGVVIGLIASAAGLRRAVRVDPALAMGASG